MRVLLSIITVVTLAFVCGTAWVDDHALQQQTLKKTPVSLPKVTVDLDLPDKDRWTEIAKQFKHLAPALVEYLETVVPKWALPLIEKIAADVRPYFKDYGDEMLGLASGMGLKVGDVVAVNLIYQLESLGLNCSNWNNTGPTVPNDPGCMAVDPKQKWCYCHKHSEQINEEGILVPPARNGPGLCTSVVAQDTNGVVYHGRNLDWNLPNVIRQLAVDVTFVRSNKTVFVGTTMVGFVGVLNGIRAADTEGAFSYSASIDARGKGGNVLENLLEALLFHAATPTQHLRKTFETQSTFPAAIAALSTGDLVDEIYYISAGARAGEGVVVSRDRNDGSKGKSADQWNLNATEARGWYRLETNYDHWQPVPKADDRRTPGYGLMDNMTQANLNSADLLTVMKTWPVFNHHTDYTGLFIPAKGHYQSIIWMGD